MNQNLSLTSEQIQYLQTPPAIRERALKIFELTKNGKTSFNYDPTKLRPTVDFVLAIIKKKYPDLNIPFHSRWGHFRAGGLDRPKQFAELLQDKDALEKARAQLDLVITSVLLDAGAGAAWAYLEAASSQSFNRSEGLGVASYHMFCSGVMSSDGKSLKADERGLIAVTAADLKKYFQVTDTNPLVGVEGRIQLLNNLGKAMANKTLFKDGRPGNIIDYLVQKCGKTIPATEILKAVLEGFGAIWPGRLVSDSTNFRTNLGDIWIYPKLGPPGSFESLVPIHKLSQWMTYSLIEPIEAAGLTVTNTEELTGLAEYRNGGLMLDSGLLSLKEPEDSKKEWVPDSETIIEWRALTIVLLDQIGLEVQKALKKTAQEFPLAKVLEGGTWWAGRAMAQEKRAGGLPPLNIKSDGTVF